MDPVQFVNECEKAWKEGWRQGIDQGLAGMIHGWEEERKQIVRTITAKNGEIEQLKRELREHELAVKILATLLLTVIVAAGVMAAN